MLVQSIAFDFRTVDQASAFITRFPKLVLADGTIATGYSSPDLPFGHYEVPAMCNLYNHTRAQDAMRQLFQPLVFHDRVGNLPEQPEIYPDYLAPIIRNASDGMELVKARWGLPTPQQFLVGKKTDRGVTNVRNVASPHWRRWLGPEFRCLVPVNRFAEPDSVNGGNVWFAMADDRPAFFAGLQVPGWTSTRKLKEGETTDDLFGILTCEPNAEVRAVHPKAMPVLLTTVEEWQTWMTAPSYQALGLQRPLPDGQLDIVLEGGQRDVT